MQLAPFYCGSGFWNTEWIWRANVCKLDFKEVKTTTYESVKRHFASYYMPDPVELYFIVPTMWAPKIAKLVYNSNNYGLWYL